MAAISVFGHLAAQPAGHSLLQSWARCLTPRTVGVACAAAYGAVARVACVHAEVECCLDRLVCRDGPSQPRYLPASGCGAADRS
jgi:hypothetical protein